VLSTSIMKEGKVGSVNDDGHLDPVSLLQAPLHVQPSGREKMCGMWAKCLQNGS
jgi:hypothetical protein